MSNVDIKEAVKERYGQAALRVKNGSAASCCGTTSTVSSGCGCGDPITANLYDSSQAGQIPEEALLASLGCGNPTILAQLILARRCSTLDRAAELMFFFLPNESDRRARLTGWT